MAKSQKTKEVPLIKQEQDNHGEGYRLLILHNDEVNSFDFVVECLIDVCDHSYVQAEQCTYIAHYKGKCDVKKGLYDDLEAMRLALLDKGLQATID